MEANNAPSSTDKDAVTENPPKSVDTVKSSNPDISSSIKQIPNQNALGEGSEPSAKEISMTLESNLEQQPKPMNNNLDDSDDKSAAPAMAVESRPSSARKSQSNLEPHPPADRNASGFSRSSKRLSTVSKASVNEKSKESLAKTPEELAKIAQLYLESEYKPALERLKSLIVLSNYNSKIMWTPAHDIEVKDFLVGTGTKRLVFFVHFPAEKDEIGEPLPPVLVCQKGLPPFAVSELMYFIRDNSSDELPITEAKFQERVQYGIVSGNSLESMLRLMNGVYIPVFTENKGWPESAKKEFSAQLHKFMAYLTDTAYQLKGHTMLYVPNEPLGNPDEVAKDKDIVQRLESLLVHWTRQIKEVVNNQHSVESAETLGPLEEIQFWKSRCNNLKGISDQLVRPDVNRILDVLKISKSSYLEQFLRLSNLIQDGSMQAQDNLLFLSSLTDPCKDLSVAEPKDIPKYLQTILHSIRMIWSNSKFYNTKERLTSLLRKVSNEIINRCVAKISLETIFKGDVYLAVTSLQESITCGEFWKSIYKKNVTHIAKHSDKPWDFDQSSIFAQIDAFMQRCRDLTEVCEGQMQFARKLPGGEKSLIPIFGGARGPEIGKSLEDIEKVFEKQLNNLWENRKYILDVKATRWHDDYNLFKQGVKDLEVMMQNVINSAFETATTVDSSIELLSIFHGMAKRDAIKRAVEKRIISMFTVVLKEINLTKSEFESKKRSPELLRFHPDFSGSANWAKSLIRRVNGSWNVIKAADFLPSLPITEEAKAAYEYLSTSIEEYINKCHSEWIASLPNSIMDRLDTSLMERKNGQMLEMKFDRDLMRLFHEIHYWQKLKFDIPFSVQEIYSKREELRILRDSVLLVVHDYNTILETLTHEELLLFRERIRFLDRKINPGLTNLTWSSKGITEHFVKECRKHSHDVQNIVTDFMDSSAKIQKCCDIMANQSLWLVESKKVYAIDELDAFEDAHRKFIQDRLMREFETIKQTMQSNYDIFKGDGREVFDQWLHYVARVDGWIEAALRNMIKKSLTDFSNALYGEGRSREAPSEIQPLFKVDVVLKTQRVEFSPTLPKLEELMNRLSQKIISTISIIPRLSNVLVEASTGVSANILAMASFFDNVAKDDEVLKLIASIQNGVANNASKSQSYLRNWDSYREIWEINKDAFIRRYAKLKPAMSTFEADINRYTEVANNTQKEETLTNINFVRLDCSPLKHALVAHCNQWQNKLTTLLNNNASNDLNGLHQMFISNTEKLRRIPANLDQLSENMNLLSQLRADSASIEGQFAPIQEQYQILEKYDVPIKEEEKVRLETLPSTWGVFQGTMNDAEKTLQEYKAKFKADLLSSVEDFGKAVGILKDDFMSNGPFPGTVLVQSAFKSIDEYRIKIQNMTAQERALNRGLAVFKIEQQKSKDLEIMNSGIEILSQVWLLAGDYQEAWSIWKTQRFVDLNVEAIDEDVSSFQKRVNKLSKDAKDWDIWITLRDKFAQLKKLIPLLKDLKNPALRDRHWRRFNEITGKIFDYKDKDFTMEKIVEYGLENYTDNVSVISEAASKELFIEQGINAIKESWTQLSLDVVSFKPERGYYKLRSSDAVTELLEDNQVTLSGIKISKFFKPFEKEVDHWERTLSHILEIVEILLQVQRQWMYLENIFIGSEDIRKQLPKESAVFDDINGKWRSIMEKMMEDKNVLRATHEKELLDKLKNMNTQLEKIQKSLDMYLETKRQMFPRFYFLSNDDLLEILGQTKDPNSVQPHLKKCFDNILRLELSQTGVSNRRHYEALGMHSADEEYVPFINPIVIEGPVEGWLTEVEDAMKDTLKKNLLGTLTNYKKTKRDKWLKDWPGQLLITASQISWTMECTKSLQDMEKGEKGALKELKRKQVSNLKKLSELVKTPLSKTERKKLVALITIEVHSRDIVEKMAKNSTPGVTHFDWLSQLRFYWDKDVDDCQIKQTNATFNYGYEYLGNSGRLVITPLTDRCFMTLTTALRLFRGGCPQGKAGSGKTESVKDLGKAMGQFVLVVNCSDSLDYKSMGRMFSGLAQTGAWSCFDEFNRIDIEVLSVVALQISTILNAISRRCRTFVFENKEIKLKLSCAVFVTMNPSYAGRTELPDNVKSLFRPVAMMVPDSAYIAEIVLFAEGFNNTKVLSKKVESLYRLASQQLSKQSHYDFGLRGLTSSLRTAGNRKRQDSNAPDDVVLFLSLRDMNVPKLTAEDVPLFMGILHDLFPGIEIPVVENVDLRSAISEEMAANNIQPVEKLIEKIEQFYDTKAIRHGVMIIGSTCSGKSTVWKTLQGAMNRLSKSKPEQHVAVRTFPINPKAMSLNSLYGSYNPTTNEWTDGVLSSMMRTVCLDEKKDQKWLVLDGMVDTLWVESMNTVLDDNKILTLSNGDRIALPETVSLVFEVDNLESASPATVSRCGMIYMDYQDLGWKPFIQSWLKVSHAEDKKFQSTVNKLIDKYMGEVTEFKRLKCEEVVPVSELSAVKSLCNLVDALTTVENGVDPNDTENYARILEMWFLFSLIWSFGGSLTEESRKYFDMFLREIEGQFPSKDTVYEYYVDVDKKKWVPWEERIPSNWRYNAAVPFHKILVPTLDTERNDFLVRSLKNARFPVLLVGDIGTGKSSLVQNVITTGFTGGSNPDTNQISIIITMSAQTTVERTQAILESKMEKRTKNVFVPVGGKKLTIFVDDLNMPRKDSFGCQPPLELLKHWMDYGFVYDLQKQSVKYMTEITLIGAMGRPGAGRNSLSNRFQSRFNVINMTFPSEASLFRIFSTILNQKLQDFEEELKPLGDILTHATVDIYNLLAAHLLPTPAKMHYLFNLRDISKVFQGLLRAHREYFDSKESMMKLWLHEMYRVFSDRLVDSGDREWFYKTIDERMNSYFTMTIKQLCGDRKIPLFGDFFNNSGSEISSTRVVYEEVEDVSKLKTFLEEKIIEHNQVPGTIPLDIVLFRDVIEHVIRIARVITLPYGHGLLIGLGGSGRRSLVKLASYVCNEVYFTIEVTKNYRLDDFREDLKKVYRACGVEKKRVVFVLSDNQIVNMSFLEDISNILSVGEVPNLFSVEEVGEIRNGISEDCVANKIPDNADAQFTFFMNRARSNLHIILCMSPVGADFRNRLRMFPSIINNTTINWFSEWPEDALLEVALKYLESDAELFGSESVRKNLAQSFVLVHTSVTSQSQTMLMELRRRNYVTPINYLELVKGYRELLKEKRLQIGNEATKLRGGLSKLDDTRKSVEKISVELDQAKKQVAQYQKQCEDYLVIIVQQKREADDQARSVAARSEKLTVEEEEVRQVANAAQADLDLALPALNAAVKALEALNKKDLTEMKSYTKPPALVEKVLEAVMVLKKAEPTWEEAKRQLGNPNFIKQLVGFDKDNISDKILKKISQYCADENFNPEIIGRVSTAAKSLCLWVRAMEAYGNIFRQVAPKREKLRMAQENLEKKQATLKEAKDKLQEIQNKIDELKNQYDEKVGLKEKLRKESEETESKLRRAEQLVSGLSGEKDRWEKSIKKYEESIRNLPGDCLLGAAFLSYAGPFNTVYRTRLMNSTWIPHVKSLEIPVSPDFGFVTFLGNDTEIRDWNAQGLPSDTFSAENGIMVMRGRRWPLMIDPQNQANRWIKNMEGSLSPAGATRLKVVDAKQNDVLRTLENAIQTGLSVLLQNVSDNIDPTLDPILNKSIVKRGDSYFIRLVDKEVEFNPGFKFYMTTKMSNPHYSPEVSAKTTIINFAVKEKGLEDQLLGIVVRKEKPELEEQKDSLVKNVAQARKRLLELENEILMLLSHAQGSILDDEKLVNALQSSKSTTEEVTRQILVSEQTESKIDIAREAYRPCAARASILFFVLNDLSTVDPMYQFSLDSYISLFDKSITKSKKSEDLSERITNLNDYHSYAVFKNACRGLFGKHVLVFSFQMTAKILEGQGKLNKDEYEFFLHGGRVIDRETQLPNPCSDWIDETNWDNVSELSRLPGFTTLISSLEQNEREWKTWFLSPEPEEIPLPGEWDSKLTDLQRILIIRSLRSDRVILCAQKFISNHLGPKYITQPTFSIDDVYADSSCKTPIVFVLSPGVDPTTIISQLAVKKGMTDRFNYLSLGQGQTPKAQRYIHDGMRMGNWVFLANCHLSISWMPVLEKLIEIITFQDIHPEFRLFLSSSPHPQFPISILQASIKVTTEPPKGIKANMVRLYSVMDKEKFSKRCSKPKFYKRLLFSLCFFHSILLERRKFLTLGWNIPYDFNDSDFDVCENLLCTLLDEYEIPPWDALKYLIAEANYGGRVTDEWDRRILRTYINQYFAEEAIDVPNFKLASLPAYYIPDDGDLASYKDFCAGLPSIDRPDVFGQHTNSDIASQIRESNNLLSTLMSLEPQTSATSGISREDRVTNMAGEILKQIPENIDYEQAHKLIKNDPSPINTVLLQEIRRYNMLLDVIRASLGDLQKGIKGLIVMNSELEDLYNAISEGKVPSLWIKTYPSLKNLGAWTRDLILRVEFFSDWAKGNEPKSYWLGAFTFPTGFLTAVLQRAARKNNIPIDVLGWEFNVLHMDDDPVAIGNKDSVLVSGISLEGAGWDRKMNCLKEPKAMELVTVMPLIQFKPVESRKKSSKGIYLCPVYYYPIRTGAEERPSFIIAVDLKTGQCDSDFFVKRGTALLLSLN